MAIDGEALAQVRKRVLAGGAERYHAANAAKGKLFARERIALLVDEGSFVEDGLYANSLADGLPADGVITGIARIDGRDVCLMANDSTVKAGSWGARTVEKIIRIIERAYATGVPMVYLVDSAGARITDQVDLFPGRRGAGKIFHTQVRASGSIPQVCALFGPSRGRRRLHPGVLRRGRDGRRQREHVPRAPTAWSRWSPGRRRRSRRWAARGCTAPSPASATSSARPSRTRSTWSATTCPTCRPTGSSTPPAAEAAGAGRRGSRRAGAGQRAPGLRHAPVRQGHRRRGLVLRDPGAVGQGADDRLRPAGRRGRRRGRQQLDVQGRRAVRRLGRQGDPVRPALRRVQRAAAVPLRRARLHGRLGGGEAGHHPARRQDDHARSPRRPCRRSAWWSARRTAPGCTRWPAPASTRTRPSRCPPRRSR